MQLENTLIKNYINELKVLRIENFELRQKLQVHENDCEMLQTRLKTLKVKYGNVKQERDMAW